jgi:hypothetical protein
MIPSLQGISNSKLDDEIRDKDTIYKEKGAEYSNIRRRANHIAQILVILS